MALGKTFIEFTTSAANFK